MKFISIKSILIFSVIFTLRAEDTHYNFDKKKIQACFKLVKDGLKEGNSNIMKALENSQFDRIKSYQKVLALILSNCYRQVTKENLLSIMENSLSINFYEKLLDFDANLLNNENGIQLTSEESKIIKELDELNLETIDKNENEQTDNQKTEDSNRFWNVLSEEIIFSIIFMIIGLFYSVFNKFFKNEQIENTNKNKKKKKN